MFCAKCGNEISDGNRFCDFCGTPVESFVNPVSQDPDPNAAYQNNMAYQSNDSQYVDLNAAYQNNAASYTDPNVAYQSNAATYTDPNMGYQGNGVYSNNGMQYDNQNYGYQNNGVYSNNGMQYENQNYAYQNNGMQYENQNYGYQNYGGQYVDPNAMYQQPPKQGLISRIAAKMHMKPKTFIILSSVLGVLIIATVVVLINLSSIINSIKKASMTDEEYLEYVLAENTDEIVDSMTASYDNLFKSAFDGNLGADIKVELEVGDQISSLLSSMDPTGSLSVLNNMAVRFMGYYNDSKVDIETGLEFNGSEVLSFNSIIDFETSQMYAQIPQIVNKWLGGIPVYSSAFGYVNSSAFDSAVYEKIKAALPDADLLNRLGKKYSKTVIEAIFENVTATETEISVMGISQDVTAYKGAITQAVTSKIEKAILEEVVQDSDIKELFLTSYNIIDSGYSVDSNGDYFRPSAEENYNSFIERANEELVYLSKYEDREYSDYLLYTVYIDSAGNIRGFELAPSETNYDDKLVFLAPVDGSDIAVEAVFVERYTSVSFSGTGTLSSDKLSGEFDLRSDGNTVITIGFDDFDLDALKKGKIKGGIYIPNIMNLIMQATGSRTVSSYASMFAGSKLAFDFDVDGSDWDNKISLKTDDDTIIGLKIEGKQISGGSIDIPYDAINISTESGVKEMLQNLDLDPLVDGLEKAGVSGQNIEALRMVSLQLKSMTPEMAEQTIRQLINMLESMFPF